MPGCAGGVPAVPTYARRVIAAIYERFGGPIECREVPDPSPGEGEVVVEVRAVGLCRSDLHGWKGTDPDITCPHVGGHEFCGVVVGVGRGVRRWRVGDRIVAPFVCGCGRCGPCRAGQHQVCRSQEQPGFTRWGAFARLTTIPFADVNAVAVPPGIADDVAAIIGCRVSTSYRGVVERGRLAAGETLAVFGCGGVGLAAVAFGRAIGAQVVAVDPHPGALALARRLGADVVLDDPVSAPEAIAAAGGAHVAVDCLGRADVVAASIGSLRPLGRHVQIGLFPTPTTDVPLARVIRDELELLGVHGLSASRFPAILDLVSSGRLDLAPLITTRIALTEVPVALPAMASFSTPGVTVVERW